MIIYNTTYQIDEGLARNFVIFIREQFIPKTEEQGGLKNGRLTRILSHKDPDTECFSLQFEAESTAEIHHWLVSLGNSLNQELTKLFKDKVVGFSTLMEVID